MVEINGAALYTGEVNKDSPADALSLFHPAIQQWFRTTLGTPTAPQREAWPAIARGESTLVLAPTGTGKTLTAFLWCLHKLMFSPVSPKGERCRVVYVSPLKALAVDVERNLTVPLAGIAAEAQALHTPFHLPSIAVRTGDTSQQERSRFQRAPADILITTPESLYLLLTSNARESLRSVDTVIVDEIHALVPTKRGTHLSLSLERLEHLCQRPLQRIGLSATQRPLEEVAQYLGGVAHDGEPPVYRPVTLVAPRIPKQLALRVEMPVESWAQTAISPPSGNTSPASKRSSLWESIYPQVLTLIRQHRSTLVFVNSRRIAERLAGALNALAEETLVYAHHGSLALPKRREVEERLKQGHIRGLVATSSLELGIDMGAVDLVIQIEAPPSVASGMQRIGRANHQVGAVSTGVLFPKFRSDLVACAAATRAMHEGRIEATHYPRNPLDVLAQQVLAAVAMDPWPVDALYQMVRRAAPFAMLSRLTFDSVLDMLSGKYPSDEFAELRPRLTWDRMQQRLTARAGTRRLVVLNVGTIADRGLFGVFLAHTPGKPVRVGELDEEMVHETAIGETFVLGASTWRVEDITHDKVLVSPASGEPGKTPFWKGDTPGRPLEFGRHIGELVRTLRSLAPAAAHTQLMTQHDLTHEAAEQLLTYLDDQAAVTSIVPSDTHVVIERYQDELGDWRMCVLTPFGGRVHAPWCMAVTALLRTQRNLSHVESLWTDDGFVIRLPHTEVPPDVSCFLPTPEQAETQVLEQLGHSSLFAAQFREIAGCALLLPKHKPGLRTPLWQQRKRAADLFAVASRYPTFPLILESLRTCVQDVFDMPGLYEILQQLQEETIQVHTHTSHTPSPFAKALLFSYAATFLYDGDAPLAERRSQALTLDAEHLQKLLGNSSLRTVLDERVMDEVEAQLQGLTPTRHARTAEDVHDLLLRVGDLSEVELRLRCVSAEVADTVQTLVPHSQVVPLTLCNTLRYVAVEEAARYRDALAVPLPTGLPAALLASMPDALLGLVRRYAHTHGPFVPSTVAARWGLSGEQVQPLLQRLVANGTIREGAFRPGETQHEYCDTAVLQRIRTYSLAQARREVEPVPPATLARLMTHWHGLTHKRRDLDAVLDVIQTLQGAPLLLSSLETDVLPARISDYHPSHLDALLAAGEVTWVGIEAVGSRDARIALFLSDALHAYRRPLTEPVILSAPAQRVHAFLAAQGASFFATLHEATLGESVTESLQALWELVWHGYATNDTFQALRAWQWGPLGTTGKPKHPHRFRSRRIRTPPIAQGRWSLLPPPAATNEVWSLAWAQQLLQRHGVLTREAVAAENLPGGFSTVYPALKTLEEAGHVRRGWFVSELGATQFALPAAVDLLRTLRAPPKQPEVFCLAATDPATPYGTVLPWPAPDESIAGSTRRAHTRAAGAYVVLLDGHLIAYFRRSSEDLSLQWPQVPHEQTRVGEALSTALTQWLRTQKESVWTLSHIDTQPAATHPVAMFLQATGFTTVGSALQYSLALAHDMGPTTPVSYDRFQTIALEDPDDA